MVNYYTVPYWVNGSWGSFMLIHVIKRRSNCLFFFKKKIQDMATEILSYKSNDKQIPSLFVHPIHIS